MLEGDWHPRFLVIVEFPDAEQLHAWYHSDEYAAARADRRLAGARDLLVADAAALPIA